MISIAMEDRRMNTCSSRKFPHGNCKVGMPLTTDVSHQTSLYSIIVPISDMLYAKPEKSILCAADEMEDGATMSVGAYQTLVVHKICRCPWLGCQIPSVLAALLDISL